MHSIQCQTRSTIETSLESFIGWWTNETIHGWSKLAILQVRRITALKQGVFQRILSKILRKKGLTNFCINYIDDILIVSETFEEHIKHLDLVINTINQEGFKLKLVKCDLAKNSIKFRTYHWKKYSDASKRQLNIHSRFWKTYH